MKYHVHVIYHTPTRYLKNKTVLTESVFCDHCWTRVGKRLYDEDTGPKEHREFEAPPNEPCDECRPLNI